MILNMMDLMTNDDMTEKPDGMRLKPDITVIKRNIDVRIEISSESDRMVILILSY